MNLSQVLPFFFAIVPLAFILGWLLGRKGNGALSTRLAVSEAEVQNLSKSLANKDGEFSKIKTDFQKEFENISNRILKSTAEDLGKSSTQNLDLVLKPLKENIESLQRNIVDTREKNLVGNTQIKDLITSLTTLNQEMTTEAKNLTRALKSDTKAQGNWGELILETILEKSGLRKGEQFELQRVYKWEKEEDKEKSFIPDAVIHLPENRDIIVDSKVNLTDFERYTSSTDEEETKLFLNNHLNAIKRQIENLHSKDYSGIPSLQSLDCVFLFIPIEAAYFLAVKEEPEILNFALKNQVILVTASTLIATLRIVSFLWKLENQNKNSAKIAEAGGRLYDKVVGFVSSFESIGDELKAAEKSYDHALKQLTGKGSVLVSAEKIKELGAKTGKQIPKELLEIDSE